MFPIESVIDFKLTYPPAIHPLGNSFSPEIIMCNNICVKLKGRVIYEKNA